MKKYYKIGEISKIYNIGKDSLIYYEKLGILNPIRDKNSYRLYSISDIWKLNLIKELRELNFSMKKIKDYIDNRSIETTRNILSEEIKLIDKKIESFNRRKNEINNRLKIIDSDILESNFDKIELKYIEQREAIRLNGDIRKDEEADFLIKKLHEKFEGKFNILGNNNIGSIFSLDKIKEGDYDYYKSVFCFLDNEEDKEFCNMILDKGCYICYSYKGDYFKKREIFAKLFEHIALNNLVIKNDPIEIYKIDIHETAIKDEFITEIQIEVEKF